MSNNLHCPHCSYVVEAAARSKHASLLRVRHLVEHAFEESLGADLEIIGDVYVHDFAEGAHSWTAAAVRARDALIKLVVPAYMEACAGTLELLRFGLLGPDIAVTARGTEEMDDPTATVVSWIDLRYQLRPVRVARPEKSSRG